MSNLPRLPRLVMNIAKQSEEKEIWQPKWNCFCCHDYGYVQPNLVRLIIPNYDSDKDKMPLCQRCDAGERWSSPEIESSLDMRFDSEICTRLDEIERQNWKETTQQKQRQLMQKAFVATEQVTKSLRTRSRTPEERNCARRRHEDCRAS
ncbi:MAG: hypothetical protein QNJ54_06700 [Prochloraceae cyanobacterium]|nr:hypothetical protein [Prochloraceae cyanobacterium]